VTSLRELIGCGADAALERQRADGSLPAGRNGLYGDPETPVRNTAHWLVTFLAVAGWSGESRYRSAAESAAGYLAGEKARPAGATFWHRTRPGKDSCNGLIGQAWTIEALAEAAGSLETPQLAELAERVFLLHPFDADLGLWRRVEVDGGALPWDETFNHQLWFAAAGARLATFASCEVAIRVATFLDRLPANLALRRSGLIRHALSPRGLGRREPRYAIRQLRSRHQLRATLEHKEAGYHAFNLYALALLRRHAPDHGFWRSDRFARLWRYLRSEAHRAAVDANPYAWPYNPTGIEAAFALDTFEGPGTRREQEGWLGEQLRRHWDFETCRLARATPDPETLAARLYEATRLPDLAVPGAEGDEPLSHRQERPRGPGADTR
jgi:hypothetical protein